MKKLTLFLFLSVAAFAQVPTIAVTSTSVVQEGQPLSLTCSANCTGLTWQVNGITGGNSTIGTITGSGSTATYTAPASIVANNVVGGCPAGPNDAIWNIPVSGTPELANWDGQSLLTSDWLMTYAQYNDGQKGRIAGAPSISDSFHIGFANSTSPLVTVAGIASIPWPQTPARGRETGTYEWNNTDQHVELVNTDTCDLWDEYADNNTTYACGGGQTCYNASSAASMPVNHWSWSGGVDAGGNLVLPYLVHLSEVHDGVIKHALHMNGPQGSDSYANDLMWPANWGTGFASTEDIIGFTVNNGGSGYSAATTITVSGGLDTANHTGQCATTLPVESQWTPTISGGVITGATYVHLGWGCKDSSGNLHMYTGNPPSFTVTVSDTGGGHSAVLTPQYGYTGLPYGARFALDQTYLSNHIGAGTSCTAGSNCLGAAGSPGVVVATALANYGMFLLDNQGGGTGWLINLADDLAEDQAARSSIASAMSTLNISHFHIYDNTKLGESTVANKHNATGCNDDFSGQPCHNAQVVANNNLNYIPPGAAWITATNASGASLAIDLLLQPATIGTPDPQIYMLAGDYSGSKGTSGGYQIPSWVRGTAATAVTWTCPSCTGTITSSGVYTPPSTLSTTGLQDIAICTLNADANVHASVYITLLPNAGNYVANTIRVDTGNTSNLADGNGHYWLGNIGYRGGLYQRYNYSWQHYRGTGEQSIYNTSDLTWNDFVYTFIVPNGNYKTRVMSGWDNEAWGPAALSTTGWNHMPYMIFSDDNGYTGEAGGSGGIKGLYWNSMEHAALPYAQDSNTDFTFGTKVVNNRLNVGLGGANPNPNNGFPACTNGCFPLPEISGVDIEPDATSPCWTIGVTNAVTQANATPFVTDRPVVAAGGKLGFYIQDYYTGLTSATTGVPDPVWSIVSGPGTLTPITLMLTPGQQFPLEQYTAPTTAFDSNQKVLIKATSQSNPNISATIAISVTQPSGTPNFFK